MDTQTEGQMDGQGYGHNDSNLPITHTHTQIYSHQSQLNKMADSCCKTRLHAKMLISTNFEWRLISAYVQVNNTSLPRTVWKMRSSSCWPHRRTFATQWQLPKSLTHSHTHACAHTSFQDKKKRKKRPSQVGSVIHRNSYIPYQGIDTLFAPVQLKQTKKKKTTSGILRCFQHWKELAAQ